MRPAAQHPQKCSQMTACSSAAAASVSAGSFRFFGGWLELEPAAAPGSRAAKNPAVSVSPCPAAPPRTPPRPGAARPRPSPEHRGWSAHRPPSARRPRHAPVKHGGEGATIRAGPGGHCWEEAGNERQHATRPAHMPQLLPHMNDQNRNRRSLSSSCLKASDRNSFGGGAPKIGHPQVERYFSFRDMVRGLCPCASLGSTAPVVSSLVLLSSRGTVPVFMLVRLRLRLLRRALC